MKGLVAASLVLALLVACQARDRGRDSTALAAEAAYERGNREYAIRLLESLRDQAPQKPVFLLAHAQLAYQLPDYDPKRIALAQAELMKLSESKIFNDQLRSYVAAYGAVTLALSGHLQNAKERFAPFCRDSSVVLEVCASRILHELIDTESVVPIHPRQSAETMFLFAELGRKIHPEGSFDQIRMSSLMKLGAVPALKLRQKMIAEGAEGSDVDRVFCGAITHASVKELAEINSSATAPNCAASSTK